VVLILYKIFALYTNTILTIRRPHAMKVGLRTLQRQHMSKYVD
jgi:hypothetical protein